MTANIDIPQPSMNNKNMLHLHNRIFLSGLKNNIMTFPGQNNNNNNNNNNNKKQTKKTEIEKTELEIK